MKLITPPTQEPITLNEAKTHLRVDGTAEDSLITGLIVAARQYVEATTHRAIMEQTWRMSIDEFPDDRVIYLSAPPLITIDNVTYYDEIGTKQTLSTASYFVDGDSEPGRLVLSSTERWPATQERPNAVTVQFKAGYGVAADVPQAIKHAILMLVAHWYEHREAVVIGTSSTISTQVSFAVDALLTPFRVWRYV